MTDLILQLPTFIIQRPNQLTPSPPGAHTAYLPKYPQGSQAHSCHLVRTCVVHLSKEENLPRHASTKHMREPDERDPEAFMQG